MLKSWMHDVRLAVQARSGMTPALLLWVAIVILASLTAFAFLCVAAYDFLSLQWGAVVAGLVMAGIFVLVALIAAIVGALARRRARERAILERAARAHAASWLLDPKILGVALQAGRALGWERIVPLALLGFLAAQWARERREPKPEDGDQAS
jgi:heme/copper-type cytochrome/quinol oxidase subunit 2